MCFGFLPCLGNVKNHLIKHLSSECICCKKIQSHRLIKLLFMFSLWVSCIWVTRYNFNVSCFFVRCLTQHHSPVGRFRCMAAKCESNSPDPGWGAFQSTVAMPEIGCFCGWSTHTPCSADMVDLFGISKYLAWIGCLTRREAICSLARRVFVGAGSHRPCSRRFSVQKLLKRKPFQQPFKDTCQ